MKFTNRLASVAFTARSLVTAISLGLVVVGCASVSSGVKVESTSVAKRLGVSGCTVSVPLSPSEVIAEAKKDGNPEPEKNSDWIKITSNLQPGDQLRLVNCLKTTSSNKVTGSFFYALVRNDAILLKFHSAIVD